MNLEQQVISQVKDSVAAAIDKELVGYNKPLSKLTEDVLRKHASAFRELIDSAFVEMLSDDSFVATFKGAIRTKMAKALLNNAGGEIDKRVNKLRQHPATRSRITLALEVALDQVLEGHDE